MTVGPPGTNFITVDTNRLTLLEKWALTTDEPLVKSIEFEAERRVYEAALRDGRIVYFSLDLFPELQNAEEEELHNVVAINTGSALAWANLDLHYGVNNLMSALEKKSRADISSFDNAGL